MCFGCGNSNHKETPTVKDIFCDECNHYRDTMIHDGDIMKNRCNHPDVCNRSRYVPGTPITKGFIKKWVYPGDCVSLNKDNDCDKYKKRQYVDRG